MGGSVEVSAFSYPHSGRPAPAGWAGFGGQDGDPAAPGQAPDGQLENAGQVRQAFEAGRQQGQREGRQAEQSMRGAGAEAERAERARQMAALVEGFAAERERYLHAVEREVVELALGIAARILRREAQMDPLLLTGAVRVALGQLAETTEVRLRVPEHDVALWSEAMAHLPNLAVRPQVVSSPELRLGECVLETHLGSVDLGVRAQLGEIERGFFDRAAAAEPEPAARRDRAGAER